MDQRLSVMGIAGWKETYDSMALYFHTTTPHRDCTRFRVLMNNSFVFCLSFLACLFFLWLAFFIPHIPHIFPPSLSFSLEPFPTVCTVVLVISLMTVNHSNLPSNCEKLSTAAIVHNLFHRKSAIHIQFSVLEIKYFCHAITLPWKDAISLKTIYLHFPCHTHK